MSARDSNCEATTGTSVVVCCHNSAERLVPTLQHLASQKTHHPWELIVVDNGSIDDTSEVAKRTWHECGVEVPLRVLDEPRLGSAFARERGVSESRYKYIVFCDDDNWLAPDYLQVAVEIMEGDTRIGALGGQNEPVSDIAIPLWFWSHARGYAVGVQAMESGDITSRGLVWGAGMVLRATVYRKMVTEQIANLTVGKQGEKLTTGEDAEICKWFILAGYRLWYDERLKLAHYIRAERLTKEYCRRLIACNNEAGSLMKRYRLVIDAGMTKSMLRRPLRLLEGITKACIGDKLGRSTIQAYNPIPWLVVDRKTRDIQLIAKRIRNVSPTAIAAPAS
jgi:glycosyltransferase involved in cell wall biosynthesis